MATRTKRTGRPAELKFKERARFDMKVEAATKALAIDKLSSVGHRDLSAYMRRCLELLAAGKAAAIPELCNKPVPQSLQFERGAL